MKKEDLKPNLLIVNKENREWGNFRVLRRYDEHIWEIRGRGGDRVLMEDELRFWEVVK